MQIYAKHEAKNMREYCARIANDPLLVQGGGGNASWKDGDTLWVKASGTWLADARTQDIFVDIDLNNLREEIAKNNFKARPLSLGQSPHRASIETMLHALMPQRLVLHIHAVEILAYLVRAQAEEDLRSRLQDTISWSIVDYCKPGGELAEAVNKQISRFPEINVVFLKNHGVIIGAENISMLDQTLQLLIERLRCQRIISKEISRPFSGKSQLESGGYSLCRSDLSQLATNKSLFERLNHYWALYPDHVVFLGSNATQISRSADPAELDFALSQRPPFIFVGGHGVYQSNSATKAQQAQLRCYYEVLIRQAPNANLAALSARQINELLNWDAEKYRLQQSPT